MATTLQDDCRLFSSQCARQLQRCPRQNRVNRCTSQPLQVNGTDVCGVCSCGNQQVLAPIACGTAFLVKSTSSISQSATFTTRVILETGAPLADASSENGHSSVSYPSLPLILTLSISLAVLFLTLLSFALYKRKRRDKMDSKDAFDVHVPMADTRSSFQETTSQRLSCLSTVDGMVYQVLSRWIPLQPDELHLEEGDVVSIQAIYEDGWCKGQLHQSIKKQGFFPVNCIRVSVKEDYDSAGTILRQGLSQQRDHSLV